MRHVWFIFIPFLLIACSKDKPAPVAPAGKIVAAPAAPTNLRFEAVTDSSVRVRWEAVDGATDYDVNYKPAVGGRWTNEPHRGIGLHNTIDDLQPNTEYRWAVRAENSDGASAWIHGPNFTTRPSQEDGFNEVSASPTNLRFDAPTDSSCTVRWNASEGATDYDVNYKPAVGGRWTNEPHRGVGLHNTIHDLEPNTEYRWAVRAENSDGASAWIHGPNFTTLDLFNAQEEESSLMPDDLRVLGGIYRLTYGPGSKRAPEWSPDGQRIIFYTSRNGWWDIYTIDPDGSNETQLTTHETGESSPTFSPDGSLIVFTSGRSGRSSVHIMDADGKNEVRLTGGNSSEEYHVWSPDGQQILYVSSPWNGEDYESRGIYVMDADGSNKRLLTDHVYQDITPAWSPDSQKIAFLSDREDYELYVMDADGGNKRRLAQNIGTSYNGPSWSPDGKRIAYSELYSFNKSTDDFNFEIFVVEVDGGNKTRLTYARGGDHSPAWSPDGERIAFTSYRTDYSWYPDSDIYIMDADGRNQRRLTNRYGLEVYLRWSPQGDRIVFEDQNYPSGSEIYLLDVPP